MFRLAHLGVLLALAAPVAVASDASLIEFHHGKLVLGGQGFHALDAPVDVAVAQPASSPPRSDPEPRAQPQPAPRDEPASDPATAIVPLIDFATTTATGAAGAVSGALSEIPVLRNDPVSAPASAPDASPPPAVRIGETAPAVAVAHAAAPAGALVAVAAVTAMAPAASSFSLDRLRRFALALGLYTRIAKERLLDHGARERLVEAVLAHPGSSLAEIARVSDIPRNTAVYHLFRLEREGLVSSLRNGRERLYFAAASWKERDRARALAAIRHPLSQRIAHEVGAEPGLDQNALCQRFGLAPSLAHWHAKRLESAGVVSKRRDGRRVRYYPGEKFGVAMGGA